MCSAQGPVLSGQVLTKTIKGTSYTLDLSTPHMRTHLHGTMLTTGSTSCLQLAKKSDSKVLAHLLYALMCTDSTVLTCPAVMPLLPPDAHPTWPLAPTVTWLAV